MRAIKWSYNLKALERELGLTVHVGHLECKQRNRKPLSIIYRRYDIS